MKATNASSAFREIAKPSDTNLNMDAWVVIQDSAKRLHRLYSVVRKWYTVQLGAISTGEL